MKWYPKINQVKRLEYLGIGLAPDIKVLPTWQNARHNAKIVRCPVCGGHKQVKDVNTDLLRDCLGCKGTGKISL